MSSTFQKFLYFLCFLTENTVFSDKRRCDRTTRKLHQTFDNVEAIKRRKVIFRCLCTADQLVGAVFLQQYLCGF